MNDVFDERVKIELTLGELENLIVMVRLCNDVFTGNVRSELEEKLSKVAHAVKTENQLCNSYVQR